MWQHKWNEISNSYADEIEDDDKELEHSSIQEKLDMELKELDKKLEQKEVKLIIFLFIQPLLPVWLYAQI